MAKQTLSDASPTQNSYLDRHLFATKSTLRIGILPVVILSGFYTIFYLRDIILLTDRQFQYLWFSFFYVMLRLIIPFLILTGGTLWLTFNSFAKEINRFTANKTTFTVEERIRINRRAKKVLVRTLSAIYMVTVAYFYTTRLLLNPNRFEILNVYYCVWLLFLVALCGAAQYRIGFLEFAKNIPELMGVSTLDKQKHNSIRGSFLVYTVAIVALTYGTMLLNDLVITDAVRFHVAGQRMIASRQSNLQELNRVYRNKYARSISGELSRAKIPASAFTPIETLAEKAQSESILLTLITAFYCALVALWVEFERSRTLKYNIQQVSETIRQMVRGEASLKGRIRIITFDSFGYMIGYINLLLSILEKMVSGVHNLTDNLTHSSKEINNAATEAANSMHGLSKSIAIVNKDMSTQNTEVEKSKGYLGELTASVTAINQAMSNQTMLLAQTSGTAEQFAQSVSHVREVSGNAEQVTRELLTIADTGTDAVTSALKSISRINEASSNMSRAMGIITKIATQTNLLSMNAAIEAAHAGVVGKGFTVVADEIRALSENSTKQSRTIRDEINIMDGRIQQGSNVTYNVRSTLRKIIRGIEKSKQTVAHVSVSMQGQEKGVNDILKSISLINESSAHISTQTQTEKQQADILLESMQSLLEISAHILEQSKIQSQQAREVLDLVVFIEKMSNKNLSKVNELNAAVNRFNI